MIRTVTGDVESISGRILAHEHLQIDLSAQKGPANKIGAAEADAVIEDLRTARALGLAAITDLSAPLWGRDPAALRRISERAGVRVICAAGFYWDPFPEVAETAPVETLRDAMIAEVETGADGTDVRCGVIKVGTAREPNEPAERLFRAAAAASKATGAPVITHTSSPDQAAWHVRVLERAGMDMSHVVISHMGAAKDVSALVELARAGVFMGVDKVSFPKGPSNVELADLVRAACDKGLERQIILSSDIARRTLLSRYGGRGYCTVFRDFVPMLEERGIPAATIETMLCDNPARMLRLAR
ncbi:MAG: phosphotriesterase-related protein [Alphaproteobacteria bacterium]|nr:phosphotriesterase-related protein [Alphaproteobacteria bacterium]